jgi:citrate synthase
MATVHSRLDSEVAHGLKGIVSHATQLSEVDGQAGRLVIRGYDIHELAGRTSFEEAAYLLWLGELPTRQQLDDVQQEMAKARPLPGPIMDVLRAEAPHATGMHALRLGAASIALDEAHIDDLAPEANRRLALRITARMPAWWPITIASTRVCQSASHRITWGLPPDISICSKAASPIRHGWMG